MTGRISVITPTRNLEKTIRQNIGVIIEEIKKLNLDYEIIIVDDASLDRTYSEAKKFASEKIKIFNFPQNKGKGFALKFGFYQSTGDTVVFIDGDLDLHPNQIDNFIKILEKEKADLVIGSKRHKNSQVNYPAFRRFLSFGYQTLVKMLLNLGVRDTQVGLKLFKKEVLVECLPRVIIKKYAFDLELLVVAKKLGYKIVEAPINLKYQFSGTGIDIKAVKNMLQDTLAVFYRLKILKYYHQNIVPFTPDFKILILNWRDIKNPKMGGAEIVSHELAKNWVKKGVAVTFFAAAYPDGLKEEVIDGVRIIRKGRPWTVHFMAWRYYKKYFQGKFDLVIDEINTIPFFTPLYVLPEKKIAFIHQLAREVWWYEFPFPLNIIGYLLEPLYLKFYRRTPILTVSESTKDSLKKISFEKNPIFVMREGVNFTPLSSLAEKEKNPTFIFLGRLNKSKRIEHIIKALEIIIRDFPETKLWLVGRATSSYQKKINNVIHKLKLENHVKLLGYLPEAQKRERLSRAWALILTSVREGWGLVVSEAAACSTPSVVYKIPGLVDSVKDEETGLICEQNNPRSLSEQLRRLVENPALRDSLSKKALERSSKFNWPTAAEETLNILKNLSHE
ncbi:MAG: glycosyltransferase [Patescibacteria group bacterium]